MKLILSFDHWRKPLHTRHHEYPNGRPRPGRHFDWYFGRANPHIPPEKTRARIWVLWLYTRDKTGLVLGRAIDIGWVYSEIVK